MRAVRNSSVVVIVALALCLLTSGVRAAGLYGDEGKDVTTGPLNSQDYWWAKYDAMMLEIAIKQHQPEGHIAVDLASSINRLADLSKKYPKHEEIKKWKDRADEVSAKIDPNANRQTSFTPQCPWDESNFAQLWVNLQWAQTAFDQHDYQTALSCMQNVKQNYEIMLRPERMKDYPDDLRKWVEDNKPVADKLYKDAKEKMHQ